MKTSRFTFAFAFVSAAAAAGTVTVKPTGRYMAVPVENGAPKIFMEVYFRGNGYRLATHSLQF